MTERTLTPQQLILSEYDFHVVIDASGSMSQTGDTRGNLSRWAFMAETLHATVRDLAVIDDNGIDVTFFSGSSIQTFEGVTPEKVQGLFDARSPRGSTPLAEALTAAFKTAGAGGKKDFLIVFTDGVPDDKEAAAAAVKKQANSQATDDACTVLFVQVGRDKDATSYLKSLDDDLKGAKFDIVDVKTADEADKFSSTAELILAAIAD